MFLALIETAPFAKVEGWGVFTRELFYINISVPAREAYIGAVSEEILPERGAKLNK